MLDCHWSLIDLSKDEYLEPVGGREFSCPEIEAIDLVASGKARIKDRPECPPQEFLLMLENVVSNFDALGLPISDGEYQAKIGTSVFPGGVRQSLVQDSSLHWKRGKEGLRELVGRRLCERLEPNCDLFSLFRFAVFECIDLWPYNSKEQKEQVYGQEYARARPKDLQDFAVDVYSEWHDSDWREFTFHALCLQADLEDTIRKGLADGRILVGQEARNGDRYIPPRVASEFQIEDFRE